MECREFGRTGLKVSVLGFGAMRLPPPDDWSKVDLELAVPLLVSAIEQGINYIDTAYVYCGGQSEQAVGQAIAQAKGGRKTIVATKNPVHDNNPAEWRKCLDASAGRLGRAPDVLYLHDVNWGQISQVFLEGGLMKEVRRAQKQGLFKHLGFSSHDSPENIRKIIDTDEFEAVTAQHNFLYRRNEPALERAREKGLGVAIMGPLGGGRLVNLPSAAPKKGDLSPAQAADLALRFVMSNPNVSTVLSGMSTPEQLAGNLRTAESLRPLSPADLATLDQAAKAREQLTELYCTGCAYCMPCPQGVDIPRVFLLYNLLKVSCHDPARLEYNHLINTKCSADHCAECGECVTKCPQEIDIPERLKDAHKTLTKW